MTDGATEAARKDAEASRTITMTFDARLWSFITEMASDRAHYKDYTIREMVDNKPQKDQILKWLHSIQKNDMRYIR